VVWTPVLSEPSCSQFNLEGAKEWVESFHSFNTV
jgi:hypothetical protein